MRVLIVVPNAVLGTVLKLVVDDTATQVRVLSVEKAGDGAIDWTSEGGESLSLHEAIDEAQMIVVSHPDTVVASEIRKCAGEKPLLGVFTESPVPFSSMSFDLFREMWSDIAEAFEAKLKTGS